MRVALSIILFLLFSFIVACGAKNTVKGESDYDRQHRQSDKAFGEIK